MSGDWVKFYRADLDSVMNTEPGLMHLWVNLLLRAAWKPTPHSRRLLLEPGQLAFSMVKFAEQLQIERMTLRRRLDTLAAYGHITVATSNRFTLVTICDWPSCVVDSTELTAADVAADAATDNAANRAAGNAADAAAGEQPIEQQMQQPVSSQWGGKGG